MLAHSGGKLTPIAVGVSQPEPARKLYAGIGIGPMSFGTA